MSHYEIDNSIPIPKATDIPRKYPFADMQVGDSILVDGESTAKRKCPGYQAAVSYSNYHRDEGIKFAGRAVEGGKVRIWRIA